MSEPFTVVERLERQTQLGSALTADTLQALCARFTWAEAPETERYDRRTARTDQLPPSEHWTEWHASPEHHAEVRERLRREGRSVPEDQLPQDCCTPDMVGQLRMDWFFWLLMAGRGSGKTRTGAEDAWWFGYDNPGARIAIVAPTNADVLKTCYEGESGLIARMPPMLLQSFNRQEKILTMTNGTQFFGYSAQEPDRLRGPQHHRAWCDEMAAWTYLDDTLDNLLMGLRLGVAPRIVATTTPRPIKRLKEILADPTTRLSRVSTRANMRNLPAIFLNQILKRYEGTRLGRQELDAEVLEDTPGALWRRADLDDRRVRNAYDPRRGTVRLADGTEVPLARVVVAVDPASGGMSNGELREGGDEYGIVVVGLGEDGYGYVLADLSQEGTPGEIGEAVVMAYDAWRADRIIYEANQGGDHIRQTITTAASALRQQGKRSVDFVPTEPVWASRGKVTRAEPVSALYEQGRVRHVGTHSRLEDQMCEFTADFDKKKMGYSPDRVDALVWGVTHLMLNDDAGTNVQDYYRQEHGRAVEAARAGRAPTVAPAGTVMLLVPAGVSTVMGIQGHAYTADEGGLILAHEEDAEHFLRQGFTRPEAD